MADAGTNRQARLELCPFVVTTYTASYLNKQMFVRVDLAGS